MVLFTKEDRRANDIAIFYALYGAKKSSWMTIMSWKKFLLKLLVQKAKNVSIANKKELDYYAMDVTSQCIMNAV